MNILFNSLCIFILPSLPAWSLSVSTTKFVTPDFTIEIFGFQIYLYQKAQRNLLHQLRTSSKRLPDPLPKKELRFLSDLTNALS